MVPMKIKVGSLLRRLIIMTNRPTGDVQQTNRNKFHNRPQKSRHNHYNARFLMDPEGQLNSMSSSPLIAAKFSGRRSKPCCDWI